MLERLKELFAPRRRGPDVEIDEPRATGDAPVDLPVGPMTSGVPPVAPLNDPAPDEPDQPGH